MHRRPRPPLRWKNRRPKKAIAMTLIEKSETFLESPSASDEAGHLLIDAWRVCLAQILEEKGRDWQRQTELMAAQSKAIIAGLEVRIANLENQIQSRLGELKDGEPGPAGPQGEQGPVGEQGPIGERGEVGERGLEGAEGQRGERGERGSAGPVGLRGPRGEKGLRGERGEQGKKGQDGKEGKKGEKGEAGERGP